METYPYSVLEVVMRESPVPETHSNEDPLSIGPPPNLQSFSSYTENPVTAAEKVFSNLDKLSTVIGDEVRYRHLEYTNTAKILEKRLHCTMCDIHIGCDPSLIKEDITHPLLRVLSCTSCTLKYRFIDFLLTPQGHDVRCRWCASPASDSCTLRFCSQCPFAFCYDCLKRNFPTKNFIKSVWKCIVCEMDVLWSARAVVWALVTHILKSRSDGTIWIGDISQCCRSAKKRVLKNGTLAGENSVVALSNGDNEYPFHAFYHPLVPLDNFILDTAWIRQRLYSISTELGKMNNLVNDCGAEMSFCVRADIVKSRVDSVVSYISNSAGQIISTCNLLTSELNRRMNDLRTLADQQSTRRQRNANAQIQINPPEVVQLQANVEYQALQAQSLLLLTSSEGTPLQVISPRVPSISDSAPHLLSILTSGNNHNNTALPSTSNGNFLEPTIFASRTGILSVSDNPSRMPGSKSKKSPRKIAPKKPPSKSQKKLSKSSTTVQKEAKNKKYSRTKKSIVSESSLCSRTITEFNGLPIKECYVKLERINIPVE